MIDDPECLKAGKHHDIEDVQIRKSEVAVQRILTAIQRFTNPFTITDKDHLYSLASATPVAQKVEVNELQAEAASKSAKEKFIKGRFQNGSEISFFDRIKKQKLLTMEA